MVWINNRLIVSKITFSKAGGIAEHYCELTACCIGKWDDNYLLYRGVNITIVDLLVVFVVNRDVYIAEILVELNVNSIFVGTRINSIGTNAEH